MKIQKKALEFQMISKELMLVTGTFIAYTDAVKMAIKLHGGVWTNTDGTKGWVVPIENYELLHGQLKEQTDDTDIKQIPWFCFAILRELVDELAFYTADRKQFSINYSLSDQMKDVGKDIPKSMFNKLYDYQKECVRQGIKCLGRMLIADEMGVGKTVESLALACVYRDAWPLLIICPTTLRLNWQDEIKFWIEDIDQKDIQVISSSKQSISSKSRVVIISYDLCSKFKLQLEECQFQIAIADEAHYLKNPQAQRSQTCVPILKFCRHVFLLSGTPAFAKPKDLFNLVSIIRPDIFSNFRDFAFRYCDPKASRFMQGFDFDGASNLKELHFLLKHHIMIRRLKKDVLSQLPSKRRSKIRLQCDPKITKQLAGLLAAARMSFEQDKGSELSMGATFMKCYSLTGKAKIKAIIDYIDDLLENEIKFLFFAHHTEVLDAIQAHCTGKVNIIRIDGNVDSEQRHKNVHLFQERSDVRVAILSLTAASVGLTLTAASTIVFGEMHWTPATMLQAEDRAHRIGQTNNVDCIYLIGQDTLDDLLYGKLEQKFGTVSSMIDGQSQKFNAIEEFKQPTQEFILKETVKDLSPSALQIIEPTFLEEQKITSRITLPSEIMNSQRSLEQKELDSIMSMVEQISNERSRSAANLLPKKNSNVSVKFNAQIASSPYRILDQMDHVDRQFQQQSLELKPRSHYLPQKVLLPISPISKAIPTQTTIFNQQDYLDKQFMESYQNLNQQDQSIKNGKLVNFLQRHNDAQQKIVESRKKNS